MIMLKQLTIRLALERPKTIYAWILFLVVACTAMIPRLNIDTDPENMLSAEAPSRIFHNKIKQQFTMRDMIVVGIVSNSNASIYNPDSLQSLNKLTLKILDIDGVIQEDLMSLSTVDNITSDTAGSIRFEWLMKDAPISLQQSQRIRTSVERLPMLANTLVSEDGMAAAIYVPIQSKDMSYQIAENIRTLFNTLESSDNYYITGLPVAEDQFGVEMFVQMAIAAPMAGLMIFLLMWLFFRSLPLVIGPMIVAMATVLITMGLLIGMGFTVHIMSSMIAIFLMPIAVVDSTHILSEFADRFRPGKDPRKVITEVINHLFTPMLYTSITSAVGFLSLMLTPIPPVRIFGAFIGFGIFLAFVLTLLFIPAYISRMKPESLIALQKTMHKREGGGRLRQWLPLIGKVATGAPRLILLIFAGIFTVSIMGMQRIEINDNPVNWFKASHEIRIADKVLNQHFAGTYDAWLVLEKEKEKENDNADRTAFEMQAHKIVTQARLENVDLTGFTPLPATENLYIEISELITRLDDQLYSAPGNEIIWLEQLLELSEKALENSRIFQDTGTLQWMSALQQALLDSGLVGKINALPDVIKTVNRELRGGDQTDFKLPKTSDAVAQALLQYQSSHRPQDLWHFVTPDYRSSLMWLQLTSGDNQHMSNVVEFVDNYINDNPLPEGLTIGWAGKAYLNVVWQDAMVSGMLDSLLSSFAVVFVMMILLFRSVKYGILAMLPLTFTITFIYGVIGWVGKDYDMPIAVLSALTLGLSIDFAIHFLERMREIHKQKGSVRLTLEEMFQEPGRAIARNAIVIAIGFTPLLFAPLVPYITVGIFLAGIMVASALVTIVMLPALLRVAHRFILKA